MFLNTLMASMKNYQKGFMGKPTLAQLSAMSIETIEERFELLLEISAYSESLRIGKIPDGKIQVPNLGKVRRLIVESNTMSHSIAVVSFNMVQIMQELSFEIIEATNNKGDFSIIEKVYSKEIPAADFLAIPKNTNFYNQVYSFTGLSGKIYTGTGVTGLSKMNTEDLKDVAGGLQLIGRMSDLRDFMLGNEDLMKKEFNNMRLALLGFMKHHIDPKSEDSKIVTFLNDNVPKQGTEGQAPVVGGPLSTNQ